MTTHVYIATAHPIGEEADVVWEAAGRSREAAIARLTEKVREGWFATDAEIDADECIGERGAAELRAERDGLDLEADDTWQLVVEGDWME